MSDSKSNEFKRPENLVRLKVDGVRTSVNTLRDQETARGVSLVCPFPALEVDIPVRYGDPANMNQGSIHRIGVEDDPSTGLPRLRLSIRTRETRATVVAKTSESLLRAVKKESPDLMIAETDEHAAPAPVSVGPMLKPEGSWADFLSEISESKKEEKPSEETYSLNSASDQSKADPKWAMYGEMPLPEDIRERVWTRRRYRMVRHVAGAFVLGMLVASLYLFDRAGVVSFGGMKNKVAAVIFGNAGAENTGQKPAESPVLPIRDKTPQVTPDQSAKGIADQAPAEAVAALPIAASPMDAAYTPGPNPLMNGLLEPSSSTSATPAALPPAAQPSAGVASSLPQAEEVAAEGDITLLLPTKWPVEYATAYRVREPNGVVVDVPGGLVKREGWLEDGKENPQVRSIKSIQRESGARFIVYVNGDLPRFITSPKQNGVSLRLYFIGDDMNTAAVAALDK